MPMEEIMSHTVLAEARPGHPEGAGQRLLGRFASKVRLLVVAFVNAWIARRDARILGEMPDDRLKDLGIGRTDIARVVWRGRA